MINIRRTYLAGTLKGIRGGFISWNFFLGISPRSDIIAFYIKKKAIYLRFHEVTFRTVRNA